MSYACSDRKAFDLKKKYAYLENKSCKYLPPSTKTIKRSTHEKTISDHEFIVKLMIHGVNRGNVLICKKCMDIICLAIGLLIVVTINHREKEVKHNFKINIQIN